MGSDRSRLEDGRQEDLSGNIRDVDVSIGISEWSVAGPALFPSSQAQQLKLLSLQALATSGDHARQSKFSGPKI